MGKRSADATPSCRYCTFRTIACCPFWPAYRGGWLTGQLIGRNRDLRQRSSRRHGHYPDSACTRTPQWIGRVPRMAAFSEALSSMRALKVYKGRCDERLLKVCRCRVRIREKNIDEGSERHCFLGVDIVYYGTIPYITFCRRWMQ